MLTAHSLLFCTLLPLACVTYLGAQILRSQEESRYVLPLSPLPPPLATFAGFTSAVLSCQWLSLRHLLQELLAADSQLLSSLGFFVIGCPGELGVILPL